MEEYGLSLSPNNAMNTEEKKNYYHAYHLAHAEERRAWQRAYYRAHSKAILENLRAYRAAHAAELKEQRRQFYKKSKASRKARGAAILAEFLERKKNERK